MRKKTLKPDILCQINDIDEKLRIGVLFYCFINTWRVFK